jgi:glycosyltransferase involved in cell wall biosynthesis
VNPLTIVIPTYERPEYLAECLTSIAGQTRTDFDLVVLDNGSALDYNAVLQRFANLDIEYVRNESSIGSGPNHEKAREIAARSEFGMVFHDDDLMHPRLVEWELGFLQSHADVVWVAAQDHSFVEDSPPPVEVWGGATGQAEVYDDRASLVRRLLDGTRLNYGSTMLRNSATRGVVAQLDRFHIVHDRPYLLDVAKSGRTALIREPLILYRLHETQDSYDPSFTEENAIALMQYYRDILPEDLGPEDERLFMKHSTNYLLHAHSFTKEHGTLRNSVRREKAEGLFRWRSIDGQGLAALASMAGLGSAFAAVRPALGAAKRALRSR